MTITHCKCIICTKYVNLLVQRLYSYKIFNKLIIHCYLCTFKRVRVAIY